MDNLDQRLFKEHFATLEHSVGALMEKLKIPGLVLSSGPLMYHFLDDQSAPFRANAHFLRWCPEETPNHFIILKPGEKPQLLFNGPEDFWHEAPRAEGQFWSEYFKITPVANKDETVKILSHYAGFSFVGREESLALENGLRPNEPSVISHLDWDRGIKTAYEIECLSRANQHAALGHEAARTAFDAGESELGAHHAYLRAMAASDDALPYHSIVGMDEKSAILHYGQKRHSRNHATMLIDSGARFRGYCSDITRTYARRSVHTVFLAMIERMEAMQQAICARVVAGASYLDLQRGCSTDTLNILADVDILRDRKLAPADMREIATAFSPHGLGHMLGLHVHDVSGTQINAEGELHVPADDQPALRMRRPLREGEVVTIEPGVYFIPMKLAPLRQGHLSGALNWSLIDQLTPLGGIRIEDDVQVLNGKGRNLTREFLGNRWSL